MEGKSMRIAERTAVGISKIVPNVISHPMTKLVTECFLRAILGFVISRAVIFGEYSPFGIGYAVAAGGSIGGLFGALGTVLGYSLLWKMADGLKYAAGTVLAFSAVYIFKGLTFSRNRYFFPAVATASAFFVGSVFVAERGFKAEDIILFITELILVFSAAYFYREVVGTPEKPITRRVGAATIKAVSLFVLVASILISLVDVHILAGISVGRLIAVIFVMVAAFRGNVGIGSSAGIATGISFDVAGGGGFYSMAYGFAGLVASIVGRNRRLPTAVAFVLGSAAITLVDSSSGINLVSLFEVFAGSVIFMFLPDRLMPDMSFFDVGHSARAKHTDKLSSLVKKRMDGAARAFSELSDAVKTTIESPTDKNYHDISRVFDRAADKTCRGCALKGFCWDRDSINTYNIMNDITHKLVKNGKLAVSDFPKEFAARCLKLESFVMAINNEMKSVMTLRRYRSRINTSRNIVGGQFSDVATILKNVAEEVTCGIEEDIDLARQIERSLREYAETSVLVWRSNGGRMKIDVSGNDLLKLKKPLNAVVKELERTLGKRFGAPEHSHDETGEQIRISESEPISVRIGVATQKKAGSSISGDCGTYFKTDEGMLYVILSDGMGTGREAAIESGSVVRLMEKFLRAGVEAEAALSTVNSALILKNMEEGGFATVDVFELDLYTGEGRIFKYGAAPSFVKDSRRTRCLFGKSYPPGTGISGIPAESHKLNLSGGEVVMMFSDGVYEPLGDMALRQLMADYSGGTPKELALKVAREALEKSAGSDDITAVIIEINSNR